MKCRDIFGATCSTLGIKNLWNKRSRCAYNFLTHHTIYLFFIFIFIKIFIFVFLYPLKIFVFNNQPSKTNKYGEKMKIKEKRTMYWIEMEYDKKSFELIR